MSWHRYKENGLHGDMHNDAFAFTTFFPVKFRCATRGRAPVVATAPSPAAVGLNSARFPMDSSSRFLGLCHSRQLDCTRHAICSAPAWLVWCGPLPGCAWRDVATWRDGHVLRGAANTWTALKAAPPFRAAGVYS